MAAKTVPLANNALIPGHLLPLFSTVAKQIYSISSLHSSLSAKSSLTTSLQRFSPFGCLIGCGLADTSPQICRFPLTPSADELLDRNPSNVIQVLVSALTDVCKISSPIVIIKQPTTWLSSKTHVPPMNIFISSHFTRIPASPQPLIFFQIWPNFLQHYPTALPHPILLLMSLQCPVWNL